MPASIMSSFMRLQVLEDGLGARELEVVLSGLESGVGNLAVVNDEGVTLGAALLIGPTNALGEASIGVGEEENVVPSDLVGLAPGAHDIGIVVGEDGNNVNTLGTDLGELLDVLGNVASRADGSEGTGKSEEDDLLVGPLLGGVVVDGDTASSDLTLVLGPGDVREDNVRGEAVTGLESRHVDGLDCEDVC